MRRGFWLAIVLPISALAFQQQQAPIASSGTIAGRVVDASTHRPVADAVVRLEPNRGLYLTSADGRFEVRGVPPSRYRVSAAKGGAKGSYGQARAQGDPVLLSLAAGQRVDDLEIPLWSRGVIAGTVLDEAGHPMPGVEVSAVSPIGAESDAGRVDTTDDRGEYRIGVDAGRYYVCVRVPHVTWEISRSRAITASDAVPYTLVEPDGLHELSSRPLLARPVDAAGHMRTYVTTYAPSASALDAAREVGVVSGEVIAGVDIRMRTARSFHVSGTVDAPAGPDQVIRVELLGLDGNPVVDPIFTQTWSNDFLLAGVPDGEYLLNVHRRLGHSDVIEHDPAGLCARLRLSVHEDLSGVVVTMRHGVSISGAFEFDDPAPAAPDLAPSLIAASGDLDGPEPARAGSDPTTFVLPLVRPGRYWLRIGSSRGRGRSAAAASWSIESATLDGVDVLDRPLDVGSRDLDGLRIRVTRRPASVSGTVVPQRGRAMDWSVVVFPVDEGAWPVPSLFEWPPRAENASRRVRLARPDRDGAFAIDEVPPGEYFVAPVSESTLDDWPLPALLRAIAPTATRVTIVPHEARTLTFRLSR